MHMHTLIVLLHSVVSLMWILNLGLILVSYDTQCSDTQFGVGRKRGKGDIRQSGILQFRAG